MLPLPVSIVLLLVLAVVCGMAMTRMVRESIAALRAHDADIRAELEGEAR